MKEKFVLVERATGKIVDVYMNVMAHHQTFFDSADEARSSNCNGIYKDRTKFAVRKVEMNAVEDDVDPPTEQEKEAARQRGLREAALDKEADELGLVGEDRVNFLVKKYLDDFILGELKERIGKQI